MPASPFDLVVTPQPHQKRARAIRAATPSIRDLFGRNPWTAAIALGLVLMQLGLTVLASALPWWGAVLLAYAVGAFIAHALFAVMHETCHRLVFRSRSANKLVAVLANAPLIVPFAIPLGHYHLVHHQAQGELDDDPDLPTQAEAELFRGKLGKGAWILLFAGLQLFRAGSTSPAHRLKITDRWLWLNVLTQALVALAVIAWLGPAGLVYPLLSLYFAFGPHPLFGRFLQEHFVRTGGGEGQETASYYGPLNRLSLNLGYHVEHHDFPRVPWNRLPHVRQAAPSFYEGLVSYRSWSGLVGSFLTDDRRAVRGRIARPRRGETAAEANTKDEIDRGPEGKRDPHGLGGREHEGRASFARSRSAAITPASTVEKLPSFSVRRSVTSS